MNEKSLVSGFQVLAAGRQLKATSNQSFFGGVLIMAKLRPLGDKILIKRVEAETKTKSGIVLPDTAKEKPRRGKVISVGEGKRLDNGQRQEISVKKGDEVIFASYAGTDIKLDGEEYTIMSEEDILAIVE